MLIAYSKGLHNQYLDYCIAVIIDKISLIREARKL